jgi:phospholipase C
MPSNLDKFDHLVVLMLENRSFDNMLGWLYDPQNAPPFDKVPGGQTFNGVSGKDLSNPIPDYAQGAEKVVVPYGKAKVMTHPNPDPGEEYYHTNTQLFGKVIPAKNRYKPFDRKPYNLPGETEHPHMDGFVRDYVNHYEALAKRRPTYEQYAQIMQGFAPAQVPVISHLAHNYAVCDNWHCSVPSQTICNRQFTHCAQSHGYVNNAPFIHWMFHPMETIFNRIQDAEDSKVTWKLYHDLLDISSLTLLTNPKLWKYRKRNVTTMAAFFKDAEEGTLPSYSFIEPRLTLDHNDQHPPLVDFFQTSSVLAGEILIKNIYDALRNGKNWERTLFVLTYDEHGGCYDHVSPPEAVVPDPKKPKGEMGFGFDRLGVRVPAILVSPYVEPGTVVHTQHEHTSIIKTITQKWGLDSLTERDKAASHLGGALSLSKPRTDRPVIDARPYNPPAAASQEPINALQRMVLMLTAALSHHDMKDEHRFRHTVKEFFETIKLERQIVHINTVGQAVEYIHKTLKPIIEKE